MPAFYMDWQSRLKRPYLLLRNRRRVRRLARLVEREGAIRHLHGDEAPDCAPDEVILCCLVRNGEPWIHTFLRHHFALGVRHVVLLDNGSTDRTLEIASSYERVSLWKTDLSFAVWHPAMRHWLIERFGWRRWSLLLDVDELFDYPRSGVLPLSGLVAYLEHNGYKTMTAQMLDMFADEPLSDLRDKRDEWLPDRYCFYDLEGVSWRRDLYWISRRTTPNVAASMGGIRHTVFGSVGLLQSKHSLLHADEHTGTFAYDSHFHTDASVADVTAVLRHYKLIGRLFEQVDEAVRRGHYSGRSKHYRRFDEVLSTDPGLRLRRQTARRYSSVDELVEQGFLTVSPAYERWVREHARRAD